MNSFEMTRRFHEAFGLGAPKRPVEPTVEDRILRAKLMFEETLETIHKGLGVDITFELGDMWYQIVPDDEGSPLRFEVHDRSYDPVETLDGIADVKVVANGTGVLFGLPVDIADRLVFESNMSKLDENGKPIINVYVTDKFIDGESAPHLLDPSQPEGKVLKSSRYKKVDLESVLRAMWPDREWG